MKPGPAKRVILRRGGVRRVLIVRGGCPSVGEEVILDNQKWKVTKVEDTEVLVSIPMQVGRKAR